MKEQPSNEYETAVRDALVSLAGTPLQPDMTIESAERLTPVHAKILCFSNVEIEDIRTGGPLGYVALFDFCVFCLNHANPGTQLSFLEYVGRPLSSAEFTKWFLFCK